MKTPPLLILLSTAMIIITSCKKYDVEPAAESKVDVENINKVKSWLAEQKYLSNNNPKQLKIQSLSGNILFPKLWLENYKDGESFIVIPIDKNFYLLTILTSTPIII